MRFWVNRKRLQSQKRHLLLHYHIFKNAGSTVTFILKRNFGRQLAFLDAQHFNAQLDNDALVAFLAKHRRVRAVSSHQLCPPKPQHEQFVFHDILFLRHPLARLSSTYDFYRRTDIGADLLTREAKRRNTAEFMQLLLQDYPQHVNNAQVNWLAARNRRPTETPLQAALRVAFDATVLGLTELFDLGAVMAEYGLQPFFGNVNFGYVAQNVSSMGPRDLEIHLSQFEDACGPRIYEQLLKCNELDMELVKLVGEEMHRRFELIPDHQERLNHFLVWRSILHPSSIRGVLASNHPHNFVGYANSGIN